MFLQINTWMHSNPIIWIWLITLRKVLSSYTKKKWYTSSVLGYVMKNVILSLKDRFFGKYSLQYAIFCITVCKNVKSNGKTHPWNIYLLSLLSKVFPVHSSEKTLILQQKKFFLYVIQNCLTSNQSLKAMAWIYEWQKPKNWKKMSLLPFDKFRPKKFFIKRCVVLNKSFVKTFFVSWLKDTRVWLRLIFLQLWLQDGLDGWQLPHVFFRHWQRKEEISNFFHPIGQVTLFAFFVFSSA